MPRFEEKFWERRARGKLGKKLGPKSFRRIESLTFLCQTIYKSRNKSKEIMEDKRIYMESEALRTSVKILPGKVISHKSEHLCLKESFTSRESTLSLRTVCEVVQKGLADHSSPRRIMIVGDHGSGKTTFLKNSIVEILNRKIVHKDDILYFELGRHISLESINQLCSNLAKEMSLRKESAILGKSGTKETERKEAVMRVLTHYKVIFIDDIDMDGRRIWKYITKCINKNKLKDTLIIGTSSNAKQNDNLVNGTTNETLVTIPVPPIASLDIDLMSKMENFKETEVESVSAFLSFSHMSTIAPPEVLTCIRENPFAVKIMISAVHHKIIDFQAFVNLCQQIPNNLSKTPLHIVLFILFQKLHPSEIWLLYQLSYLRSPLPVKNNNCQQQLFNLINLCLVDSSHSLSEEPLRVIVPNGICIVIHELIPDTIQIQAEYGDITSLKLWKDLLAPKLKELLSDAKNQAWPFIPETWQYTDIVGAKERYSVRDLINQRSMFTKTLREIDILQECLYHALITEDYEEAATLVYLMDRFTYWQGTSKGVISIVEFIQKKDPRVPIAPQLVIRQARILKNEGDLQGAERMLDNIISQQRKIGQWRYQSKADYQVVYSVCVQIKGDIRRGLGLWLEASRNLISSIVLFKTLPKPDKKGWASSLSLLADAFQYMPSKDFNDLAKETQLTTPHPVLEAIRCVTEAAQLCIYNPLFFAKNKRRAGELNFSYAKLLPECQEKFSYLMKGINELREGLSCHNSISSLESREQLYEFVASVYKFSQICNQPIMFQYFGPNLADRFEHLSKHLYEVYCSFAERIQHDDWSSMLIQTTLRLQQLPEIPSQEKVKVGEAGVPDVQVKSTLGTTGSYNHRTFSGNLQNNRPDVTAQIGREEIKDCDTKESSDAVDSGKGTSESREIAYVRSAVTRTTSTDSTDGGLHKSTSGGFRSADTVIIATNDDVSVVSQKTSDSVNTGFRSAITAGSTEEKKPAPEIQHMRTETGSASRTDEEMKSSQRIFHMVTEDVNISRDNVENVNGPIKKSKSEARHLSTVEHHQSDEQQHSAFRSETTKSSLSQDQQQSIDFKDNAKTKASSRIPDAERKPVDLVRGVSTSELDFEPSQTAYATQELMDVTEDMVDKRMQKTKLTLEGSSKLTSENELIQERLKILTTRESKVHGAKVWRFDPLLNNWTTFETLAYIGEKLQLGDKEGACRDAFMVEHLNQDEPMSKYVGKQYKLEKYKRNPRSLKQYKQDVICQVTSRYYSTLFNQQLYMKGQPFGQVQFLPAVVLELLDVDNDPEKYYNVEPYMAGDFTKITNNLNWVVQGDVQGKDLLLAFSHFSYCASKGTLIVVDIQGWTSQDQRGLTFLTDPQIHTKDKKGYGTANRGQEGFNKFWQILHPQCNHICALLNLSRPQSTG